MRESQNLSRKELANKAGVSPSTLVKLELDTTTPSAYTLFRLAQALGVDELALIKIFYN